MKIFFRLLILISCLSVANAQENLDKRFNLKEAFPEIYTAAKLDLKSNPLLTYAQALILFNPTTGNVFLPDLSTGDAYTWTVVFCSESDTSKRIAYDVQAYMSNNTRKFAIESMAKSTLDKYYPQLPAIQGSWMWSDSIFSYIKENKNYQLFRMENDSMLTGLILQNQLDTVANTSSPTWFVKLYDKKKDAEYTCRVNAITGETYCPEYKSSSDVEIVSSKNVEIYPNPVNDKLFINLSEEMKNTELDIQMFDIQGNEILTLKNYKAGSENIFLPTEFLNNGTYCLKITSQNNVFNSKFVISK
jgi:hypothetical protein